MRRDIGAAHGRSGYSSAPPSRESRLKRVRDREDVISNTRGRASPYLRGESFLDQPVQMRSDCRLIQTLDDFV
jgi:hypothetical protein